MAAMIGQNSLNKINKNQSSISEKLASGYKINRAADNVEGCAISEKMRDQTRGLNQAYRNSCANGRWCYVRNAFGFAENERIMCLCC